LSFAISRCYLHKNDGRCQKSPLATSPIASGIEICIKIALINDYHDIDKMRNIKFEWFDNNFDIDEFKDAEFLYRPG
jgi:hypothetical protein